jgi:murein DD-endopeptidase MepM/ murein hydrolase activator NlpD
MKVKAFLLIIIAFIPVLLISDHIENDKGRWKAYFNDSEPINKVNKWLLPFKSKNRTDRNNIKVVSTFGSHRNSYLKGHKHTGLDLVPKKKAGKYVNVYPMADGVVCSIHLGDPHRTIVVKHRLDDGSVIYTSYKHLKESYVENGQQVGPDTKLARLYTKKEAREIGGNYDHLHLEIRKKFDDYGVASWATLSKTDLEKRFYDPLKFIKERIKKK